MEQSRGGSVTIGASPSSFVGSSWALRDTAKSAKRGQYTGNVWATFTETFNTKHVLVPNKGHLNQTNSHVSGLWLYPSVPSIYRWKKGHTGPSSEKFWQTVPGKYPYCNTLFVYMYFIYNISLKFPKPILIFSCIKQL